MIPFGILGCFVLYIVNPFFNSILSKIPVNNLNVIALIIFVIYLIDNILSLTIMFGFKGTLKTIEKDGTEEITKKVKEVLLKRNFLYKRLIKAFPNIKNKNERLEELKNKINKEIEKIKH